MSPLRKIKVRSIQNTPVIKPVTWKHLFWLILILGLFTGIVFGGPALTRLYNESQRKAVDKNSAIVKAVVYRKSSHKGRTVSFKYFYKGIQYKESEAGEDLYDNLDCGDKIVIKIDTLDPENAYIIEY